MKKEEWFDRSKIPVPDPGTEVFRTEGPAWWEDPEKREAVLKIATKRLTEYKWWEDPFTRKLVTLASHALIIGPAFVWTGVDCEEDNSDGRTTEST